MGVTRGPDPYVDEFEVPYREDMVVLDALNHIKDEIDGSLTYRWSCRMGVCGSCGMMVNGVPRWTCRTHVDRVAAGEKLELAPLRNLPVIRDLVADMREFFDKWARAKGEFRGRQSREDEFAKVPPQSPPRLQIDATIECIGCGVCYAACDVVAWNPRYLGPAALNRAWTLVKDERDRNTLERLRAVSGERAALLTLNPRASTYVLRLRAAATISGSVRHAVNDTPVAGARVSAVGVPLSSSGWQFGIRHPTSQTDILVSVNLASPDYLAFIEDHAGVPVQLVGVGPRRPAFHLFTASLAVKLATDSAYCYLQLVGRYQIDSLNGKLLDAGWLAH